MRPPESEPGPVQVQELFVRPREGCQAPRPRLLCMFLPFEAPLTFCISSDALSFMVMKLRFRHVRRTPQRAWIGSIRIELQHLVVKLSRRRRHLGDAFEIADVLTGLFDYSGAVVLLGFLMSGDHRAWFQFLDCVECRDPLLAGPRV